MVDASTVSTSSSLLRELKNPETRESAWRTFLERYRPLIFGWCCRSGLSRADADEITAAVFANLVKVMTQFVQAPGHRFRAWLKTVVNNEVRTLWRQRGRRPADRGSGDPAVHRRLEEEEAPESLNDLLEQLDKTLQRDLERGELVVARVKDRLKRPETWEAFWLTAIEGERAADVARKLNMKVAAVFMAKQRVSMMLREEGQLLQGPPTEWWREHDQ
jgi:RNA polymerase sigma-70 factor (ECF subfamily)